MAALTVIQIGARADDWTGASEVSGCDMEDIQLVNPSVLFVVAQVRVSALLFTVTRTGE